MDVYLSTNCLRWDSINAIVDRMVGDGVLRIELTGATSPASYDEAALLRHAAAGVRLRVHNYFPPPDEPFIMNLSSPRPEIARPTERLVREGLRVSALLGADCYSVHAGYGRDHLPEPDGDGFQRRMPGPSRTDEEQHRMIARLLPDLPPGVRLALENGLPSTESHLASPEAMERFLERYRDEERVGLLLDLGHLNVSARTLGFDRDAAFEGLLLRHADRIFEIHVSANDGSRDTHRPTPPGSAEIGLLQRHAQALGNTAVALEWHGCYDAATPGLWRELSSLLG